MSGAHEPKLAQIHCKCTMLECGHDGNDKHPGMCLEPVSVVKGSKAHKEGLCNLCIYAQILAGAGSPSSRRPRPRRSS